VDVLSDVLRVVRLSGAVFFTADFSSPWAIESPLPDSLAATVMPHAESVVLFHILVDGACEVACPHHPLTTMEAGDLIAFPRGDQHVMRSHATASTTPLAAVFSPGAHDEPSQLSFGDGAGSIQDVATRVGDDSEAAFNRAFKRATGSPPAAWRKGALAT
jgi:AraC family transcriptional regulator, alkane utilization regulator